MWIWEETSFGSKCSPLSLNRDYKTHFMSSTSDLHWVRNKIYSSEWQWIKSNVLLMELTWPWPQMVLSALWPTKLAYHVVKGTWNISAALVHTLRCSSCKGSSSSLGGVCIAITTTTRKDGSHGKDQHMSWGMDEQSDCKSVQEMTVLY